MAATGWDTSSVTYSQYSADSNVGGESELVVKKLREFLRNFRRGGTDQVHDGYRQQINSNYNQQNYKCQIDFQDLQRYDKAISEMLRKRPGHVLPLFEKAAKECYRLSLPNYNDITAKDIEDIQIQIVNFRRNAESIRNLGSEHVSRLVQVPGIVISAGKVAPRATRIRLQCSNCRKEIWQDNVRGFGSATLPRACDNAANPTNEKRCPLDPFVIVPDKCVYVNTQKLKLQENPEDVPTGEMPRQIWLSLEREHIDNVNPGCRVNVIGEFSIYQQAHKKNKGKANSNRLRHPYLRVVGMELINASETKGSFKPEEEEELKKIARTGDVYKNICDSIAPAIWGNDDIKKAVACLLFGGSRKFLAGGMRLRGDINVLLLGDPSCGKSQFLKFVQEVAPIAVYTSGKGSSAAGLTASVLRDPTTGQFMLEGGAMVLADGGVVCIDEFDKMREQDRIAIHEAMEQQTISISKAGINAMLNSRCSVLAAANPIFGRYDDMRTVADNIDFQTTILSRFDLIFIVRDKRDPEMDKRLANHIMDFHINVDQSESSTKAPITADTLSKYIAFARKSCSPRLTPEAMESLKNAYVSFRQTAKIKQEETKQMSAIPITVRQLEAIIRITESLAKMELSDTATEEHVKEAVRIFRFATMKAVQQGNFVGESLGNNQEFIKKIQAAERAFKGRVGVQANASVNKVVNDLKVRGHDEQAVVQALHFMFQRAEIEYFSRRTMIRRKK